MRWLDSFGIFLKSIDQKRDSFLAPFIRRWWPRQITPNFLTSLRIAIAAALFTLLFEFSNSQSIVIMPLFGIGALSDLFDGSVARILEQKTDWGRIMDPVADRLLVIPIAIYSLISFQLTLLLLLIAGEIINALLSLYLQEKNRGASSNIFGKTKMVLQSVALAAILLFWPHRPNVVFIALLWLSLAFLILSIIAKIIENAQKTINL